MRHEITRHNNSIEIRLTGIGNDGRYFGPFNDCAPVEDRCDGDTYRTLDSLRAQPLPDGVHLELKARPDAQLDLDEAETCLDNAVGQILENREKAEHRA